MRGVCVMALCSLILQGSHCLEQTEKNNNEGKEAERGQVGKRKQNYELHGYWPYHAYMLAFPVRCLSAGFCY